MMPSPKVMREAPLMVIRDFGVRGHGLVVGEDAIRQKSEIRRVNSFMFVSSLLLIFFSVLSCSTESHPKSQHSERIRINPRSAELEIRATILSRTPLGTSAASVVQFANENLTHLSGPAHYDRRNGALRYSAPPGKWPIRVGTGSVRVPLGRYRANPIARTWVWVQWAFNQEDRLIDVLVHKDIEGL